MVADFLRNIKVVLNVSGAEKLKECSKATEELHATLRRLDKQRIELKGAIKLKDDLNKGKLSAKELAAQLYK